jgi:cytochrome P450
MVARMLESHPGAEQQIKDIAGIVYLAGSDTTVAAVTSFFLAALVYPDVQKKAQAELDRVMGRHRLPDFADKAELPYLEAVMRECLRWLPVLPTGRFALAYRLDRRLMIL